MWDPSVRMVSPTVCMRLLPGLCMIFSAPFGVPISSMYLSVTLEHSLCGREELEKVNGNHKGRGLRCRQTFSSEPDSETNNDNEHIQACAVIKSFINITLFS